MHTKKIKFCMQKFFSENVCLRTKLDLLLKKKQKSFWGKFSKLLLKNFCVVYGNCMVSIFFKKKIKSVFFCHHSVQLLSKSRRNSLIFFYCFFENV